MGKRLVITEKPSVARDIVGALGGFAEEDGYWESDGYVVTFAVGHLLELMEPEDLDPKYRRWTLDTLPILPEQFPLKPKEGTRDRLRTIKKLMERQDVGGLINACDAGREGELIFRELVEYMGSPKPIERLWLQSMTKQAIQDGFSKLQDGERYEGLSQAAHCRNYSDWLIGMNATRALTRRLKSRSENQAWSAGRVQTPTLAMLVDREMEVLEHVPVGFWRVRGTFEHGGEPYAATWFDPAFQAAAAKSDEEGGDDARDAKDDRIFDEARAQAIFEKCLGKPALASETRKPSREAAPPLFDLTSLQREANRRFGWSARRTLNAAQRCYEGHKILTYPRTDAKALPAEYGEGPVQEIIASLAADPRFTTACARLQRDGLMNREKIFDDAKVTDHFAIVPTGLVVEGLQGDDARLYDLVARRFLGAFHPPALWSRVERTTVVDGERFRSRSKVLQEAGWREVLGETEGAGAEKLSPLVQGADDAADVAVATSEILVEADETKPPARITEARLLSLMESAGKQVEDEDAAEAMKESGIGTPATRADTIENLISKGYVMRSGRVLRPSVKGIRLIDILRRMNAERLASPALTGELEHHLNEVEHGRTDASQFMSEVVQYTKEIVELTKGFEFEDLFPNDEALGKCPLCAEDVYERSWFYRCKEPPGLERVRASKKTKKGEEPAAPAVIDCPFRIWKDKSGRYIDRRTVGELLRDGKSRVLDGFMTQQGRTFRGQIELADGEVQLRRMAGGDGEDDLPGLPEYEVNETPLGGCPVCREAEVVETRSTYICARGLAVLRALDRDESVTFPVKKKEVPEGMEYCAFVLPRTICKRELTRDEATDLIVKGKTELLPEFTSKRGRPFSAILLIRENGRYGFEFPPRGAAAAEGAEGAEGEAATGKATGKKAAGKKAAGKKAAGKKAPGDGAGEADGEASDEAPKKAGAAKKSATKKAAPGKKSAAATKGAKAGAEKTGAKKAAAKPKAGAKKKAAKKKAASKRAEGAGRGEDGDGDEGYAARSI